VTGATRTLLVVSGQPDALPVITAARRLGVRVLVSDGAPDAPGFRLADAGLLASIADAEGTVEAARAYAALNRIDGVLGVGAGPASTVAAVAHALGLPGVSLAAAALIDDRLATMGRLAAAGVAVPWTAAAPDPRAVEAARAPCFLKPVDGAGAEGVVYVVAGTDPGWAFEVAAAGSRGGHVMLEQFVTGLRVSVAALVVGGRVAVLGVADRADGLPGWCGRGREMPSRLRAHPRERIEATLARAIRALGIERGPLEAELVVGSDGPVIVGLTVGMSQSSFWSHTVSLATGIDAVGAAVRVVLGDELPAVALRPLWSEGAAERFLVTTAGRVIRIVGAEEAAAGDGVVLVDVRVRPGQQITSAGAGGPGAGVVVAGGPTRVVAVVRAERAAARVRILTAALAAPTATLH
jgi:biotin carboxylase